MILSRWRGQKTNPIQTQLKPKQSQFNPKQTQFKANQSQILGLTKDMIYLTLARFRYYRHFNSLFTHFPSTNVENIRQITPFYAKQTQFQKCKMNITTTTTMIYVILSHWLRRKNKPNSKPITKYQKAVAGRIMFLLLFFVNMGCGYADKNV